MIALVLALLVLAAPAAAQDGAITLSVDKADVLSGTKVRLTGRADGVSPGTRIEILADTFPFDRYGRVALVRADGGGNFRSVQRAKLNTHYRVRVQGADALSPVAAVYPYPGVGIFAKGAGRDRVEFTFRQTWEDPLPSGTPLRTRPVRVYFYVATSAKGRYTRVASTRFRSERVKRTAEARVTVKVTATIRKLRSIRGCIRRLAVIGVGRETDRAPADCGRSTMEP